MSNWYYYCPPGSAASRCSLLRQPPGCCASLLSFKSLLSDIVIANHDSFCLANWWMCRVSRMVYLCISLTLAMRRISWLVNFSVSLTQVIDNFARLLVDWLRVALHGMPESLREVKFDRRFHHISLIIIKGHSRCPSASWKPSVVNASL